MITVKELAERCNVSIATVSNIINNKNNVSEKTKQKVLKVAKELGYQPNMLARNLRIQKTKTIGLIIEEITVFSTSSIVEGIMDFFEKKGYRVIFENLRVYSKLYNFEKDAQKIEKDVDSAVNLLLSYRVDGIIYVAAHSRRIDFIKPIAQVPLVLCYSECNNSSVYEILVDDFGAAKKVIDNFCFNKYQKIAIIKSNQSNIHANNRFEGCLQAFKQNKINFDLQFVVEGDWTRESGYKACEILQKQGFFSLKEKKAIFCFNDLMAAGVYDYLFENNYRIPQDVAVAGFDNREISQFLRPELTTMEIPLFEIGKKSASVLFNILINKEEKEKNILIPCKLIQRNSV